MMPKALRDRIRRSAVIAVLVIDKAEDAVPVARALLKGGVDAMELTLRTEAALDALRNIRAQVPEMLVGIGTILRPKQVDQVVEAGAAFGVSPGLNPRVLQHARERNLPFAPGVLTPSDIEQALEWDCRTMKFFPSETSGGLKHLSNLAAPYLHLGVDFIPLGGLNAANMADYLRSPLISALGGSWLAKREAIAAHDWEGITGNATEARRIADDVRS